MSTIESYASEKTIAWPIYLGAIVMGTLYITDVTSARALASEADDATAIVWQYCMLIGGVVGLFGARRWFMRVATALTVEMIAIWFVLVATSLYVAVLLLTNTLSSSPWATIVWIGLSLNGVALLRFFQARRQRKGIFAAQALAEKQRANEGEGAPPA